MGFGGWPPCITNGALIRARQHDCAAIPDATNVSSLELLCVLVLT